MKHQRLSDRYPYQTGLTILSNQPSIEQRNGQKHSHWNTRQSSNCMSCAKYCMAIGRCNTDVSDGVSARMSLAAWSASACGAACSSSRSNASAAPRARTLRPRTTRSAPRTMLPTCTHTNLLFLRLLARQYELYDEFGVPSQAAEPAASLRPARSAAARAAVAWPAVAPCMRSVYRTSRSLPALAPTHIQSVFVTV